MGIRTVRLRNPSPGAQYRIRIPEAAASAPLSWQSFPKSLGDEVTFLFASCFWRPNDKEGAYSAAVRHLHQRFSPTFKLLVGDQVYQDWPSAPPGRKTPLDLYADRYAEHPNRDRLRYNLWETLGVWQGYLWSHGARPNPLREGFPIFSSAYAEYAFEGIGVDLTPGASERNSAPEHIWNAAIWWQEAFQNNNHLVSGFYVLRDLCACLLDPPPRGGS